MNAKVPENHATTRNRLTLTDFSFTPSEYIFLNGEKFVPAAEGSECTPLLCSDTNVNGRQLAVLLVMGAILANESEGVLKIESHEKKKIFGGVARSDIYLHVIQAAPNWSGYTLESAVMFLASRLFSSQAHTLYNVVHTLLAADRQYPWQKIIELVEWGLVSSNWLIPVKGDAVGAFSTPFICPGNVRELALEQPAKPIIFIIEGCKQRRPELWQRMTGEIEQAMRDRRS